MGAGSRASAEQRQRVLDGLQAYASSQSALGREFARHMGMHTTDSAAVVEILRADELGHPITPARLAERIELTSGATSILLNRLEEAGHVTRTRGNADRRMVTLHSTSAVHAAAGAFFAPVRSRLDAVASRYSPDQLDLVEAFVRELRDAVADTVPPPERPAAAPERVE